MTMEEIVEETNGKHGNMVEITVKIIGPARPSRLHVPPSVRVHDLRKLIAGKNRLPVDNLKLILRGKVLHDREDEDDIYVQLNDVDSLIVAVKPKAPTGLDIDDDEEDLKFQLPQSTSRYPFDGNFFSQSQGMILGTGFCTNFLNLGRRQPGNVSAYSIFNEDFRELPGTLNADAIDRDIRTEFNTHSILGLHEPIYLRAIPTFVVQPCDVLVIFHDDRLLNSFENSAENAYLFLQRVLSLKTTCSFQFSKS
ncbi:hypothetical protein V6N13_036220 [Hibiscus sabdariffa]